MSQWLISPDKFLSANESKRLRRTCREGALAARARGVQAPVRDHLIIEVVLGTGLRVSELSSLKVQDLDLRKGQNALHVRNGMAARIELCNSVPS